MEIIAAVIGGVIVFMVGEYLRIKFVNPAQEYIQLKGRIAYALTMHSPEISYPLVGIRAGIELDSYRDASHALRTLASEVSGFAESRCKYQPFVPSEDSLIKARKALTGLSNNVFAGNVEDNSHAISANVERWNILIDVLDLHTIGGRENT
ncbi:hypothetical protein ACH6CV_14360 [Bacillota bacterium Meth-B3]